MHVIAMEREASSRKGFSAARQLGMHFGYDSFGV